MSGLGQEFPCNWIIRELLEICGEISGSLWQVLARSLMPPSSSALTHIRCLILALQQELTKGKAIFHAHQGPPAESLPARLPLIRRTDIKQTQHSTCYQLCVLPTSRRTEPAYRGLGEVVSNVTRATCQACPSACHSQQCMMPACCDSRNLQLLRRQWAWCRCDHVKDGLPQYKGDTRNHGC